MIVALIWGGTQITPARVAIAIVAELALVGYFVWAWRLFGR